MMSTQLINLDNRLIPGNPVPFLEVPTIDGKLWQLSESRPRHYTMVVFYRGLHCPLCREYLKDLDNKLKQLAELGIEAIAISGDNYERAVASREKWGLSNLRLGYGLTRDAMKRWGLYISPGKLSGEPEYFNESGLFLIQPDGMLFFAGVNNAPYGRPDLDTLLSGLDYVLKRNYPLRGTEV